MYKIGLISKPSRDLTRTRAELSPYGYFQLNVFTSAPKAVSKLKERSLNALVVILDSFTLKQLGLAHKINQFHPSLPVAFMANYIDIQAQEQALKLPNVIVLNAQLDLMDLNGILVRMMRGLKVVNRVDRRQPTLQTASIADDGNDFFDKGIVLDLAARGARLRSFKQSYVKGDKIRLRIPLTFLRKTYEVNAEVVWSQNEPVSSTHPTKSQLLGLKFLSVAG